MEQEKIEQAINDLVVYWNNQNIDSKRNVLNDIISTEKSLGVTLPPDIKQYFLNLNGMERFYPNFTDQAGFLFYPLEYLTTYEDEFNQTDSNTVFGQDRCVIFANFMQKSWWYGILIKKDNPSEYSIIIIPGDNLYKIVANSFAQFIEYYINDSPKLYDHGLS
jgi:hypothetical protein